ncbi:MAG: hypothetical protein NT092_10135 [Bacteroidia bacterium]|nr:hypothetical protein [Bacteroidia bacterium]
MKNKDLSMLVTGAAPPERCSISMNLFLISSILENYNKFINLGTNFRG